MTRARDEPVSQDVSTIRPKSGRILLYDVKNLSPARSAAAPDGEACLVVRPLARSLISGGASRDRTDDPLLAKQVLSQLSYGPDAVLRLALIA